MAALDAKKDLVAMLDKVNPETLTMQDLQHMYEKCVDCLIAMVFLADILFRAVKIDLEDLCSEVEALEEALAIQREAKKMEEKKEEEEEEKGAGEEDDARGQGTIYGDVYIKAIAEWVVDGVQGVTPIGSSILKCFLPIAYALAKAYANPCNSEMGVGQEALLSWQEFQGAASTFSRISRPRIVDALLVIRCLRRKPMLNCSRLSHEDSAQLAKFDKNWNRLCSLYPVVNILADPPLVIVEPVGGGSLPPQVATTIAAITSAANHPLPSRGGVPIPYPDILGTFSNIFQLRTREDARQFADMLRVQLSDTTGAGGPGLAVRILCINVPPTTLRIY
ncbi:hypothetical protein L7F22_045125 [Adiantum nelumboides]|nr:hypothetical protein [Adiantum nelumboides]